jgi:hypothetical protein
MNPLDQPLVKLSMGWGRPTRRNTDAEAERAARQSALHRAAVARRRKAKRGGKR